MTYNDDEALREVYGELRRNRRLKDTIARASRVRDYDNVSGLLSQILASLGRTVDNFVDFVDKAVEWFKNL